MATSTTCFIISPIGADGSEQRAHADRWLNLIVLPALAVSGFTKDNIFRADSWTQPGATIADDILTWLIEADLCIADLCDLNPNVMYECGFRQGLGRPLIVLAPTDQALPFDLAHRRALFYDMSTPESVNAAMNRLVGMIGALAALSSLDPEEHHG